MTIITPEQLVSFFNDVEARVNDEVERICGQLLEREPATCRPKNRTSTAFALRMPEDFDAAFVEKVAAKFRETGWDAKVASHHDITGQYSVLELASSALSALPPPPQSFRYATR